MEKFKSDKQLFGLIYNLAFYKCRAKIILKFTNWLSVWQVFPTQMIKLKTR